MSRSTGPPGDVIAQNGREQSKVRPEWEENAVNDKPESGREGELQHDGIAMLGVLAIAIALIAFLAWQVV